MEERDEKLFEALSNTSENVYIFQNDMETGISTWSPYAIYYFDLPDDYETDTLEKWKKRIHPEDWDNYLEDVNAVFTGKKKYHRCQYRARNRYGDYVWLECMGNLVYDAQGKPTLFAGMMTRLDNQTKYDSLTKQLTIHQFYMQDSVQEATAFILFGIDDFRRIILNLGYGMGNKVLQILSDELSKVSVEQKIYRMEGDEFLVALPGGNQEDVRTYFEQTQIEFHKGLKEIGFDMNVNFSGAATLLEPGECNKETLIKRLEHSMEQAKREQRGQLVFFTKEIESKHRRNHEITEELREAIQDDFRGFELYYQPVKTKRVNRICTVEALLRFYSEKLGDIAPVEFIPILESTGQIKEVGLWVMRETLRQNKEWNREYDEICTGFNVSYLQLQDGHFAEELIKETKRLGIPPRLVTVELTESCKVENITGLAVMFRKLKEAGFRTALDDFGMEYSSLTLIRDIPVTTVKIDHSFVRTLKIDDSFENRANMAIISCINDLCKELGIRVVVEGIENMEVSKRISKMDVDFLQGYYYSKPIPASEVVKYFK